MFAAITYGTFIFFATMAVLGALYMYLFVPETNGVILEDMDVLFGAKGFAPQQMKAYKEYLREKERANVPKEANVAEVFNVERAG